MRAKIINEGIMPEPNVRYYEDQLNRLGISEHDIYAPKIKLVDGDGNNTTWMELNKNSIPVFIKFLEQLKNKVLNK